VTQWAFESQGLLLEAVPTTAALATMMGASLGWMAVGARRRVLQNDQALHILKETGQVVNHVLLGMEGTETPHLRIAGTDEFTSSLVVPEKSPAVVVESIGGAVGALAGTIYFRSTMSAPLELVATHGLEDDHLRGGILNLDREIIRRIESDGMPIVTSRLRDDPDFRLVCPEARSILSVPLLIAGSLAGVVNLYNKKPTRMSPQRQFDADDLRLVSTMAHQAAVTLHNAKLYERVHKLFLGAITSLSAAIDAKDPYTRGHSERVAKYSRGIAEAMGMTSSEVEVVELSALLHDVGKIAVHDAVLTKPGRLTDEEWGIFRNHPARGVEILSPIEALGVLSPGIRHHHERFDGKGYPDGLAGEAIPLIARIICVADSYDAMTSDRSYRSSLGRAKALGELRSCAGTQFDPVAARVFVQEVLREPFDAPEEGLKKAS
jgi:HD-GYP domain-containing protein (c-di-GMP phosphodiesterase class II)